MFSQFIHKKVCQNATVSSAIAQDYALFTMKRTSHFLSVERDWKGPKPEREFCSSHQRHWQFLEAEHYLHIKRTHFSHGNMALL